MQNVYKMEKDRFTPKNLLTSPNGRKYELLARHRIPGSSTYGKFAYCDRIRFEDDSSYLHIFYDENSRAYKKSEECPEFMLKL